MLIPQKNEKEKNVACRIIKEQATRIRI